MNLFDSPHSQGPRPDRGRDQHLAEGQAVLAHARAECGSLVNQISSFCDKLDKTALHLRKIDERLETRIRDYKETTEAYNKEARSIADFNQQLSSLDDLVTQKKPEVESSLRELLKIAEQIAEQNQSLRANIDISKCYSLTDSAAPLTLGQLAYITSELHSFHKSVRRFLEHAPTTREHPHLLERFYEGPYSELAATFARAEAELSSVRLLVRKMLNSPARKSDLQERLRESEEFVREFLDELDRCHYDLTQERERRDEAYATYSICLGETKKLLSSIYSKADEALHGILENPEITPTQREVFQSIRERWRLEVESFCEEANEECGPLIRPALATVMETLSYLEHMWASPEVDSSEVAGDIFGLSAPPAGGLWGLTTLPISPEQLRLTYLSPSDMSRVMKIEEECFESPWAARDFVDFIHKPQHDMWGALHHDQIVGFMCLAEVGNRIEIKSIAVAPEYRRQGVGHFLVTKVIERSDGDHPVSVIVREGNLCALQFFTNCGFRVCSVIERYFIDSNEKAITMEYAQQSNPRAEDGNRDSAE